MNPDWIIACAALVDEDRVTMRSIAAEVCRKHGTTGEAAWREGMRALLIEREPEYQADIVKRMALALAGPDARRAASVKQLPADDLPMFAQVHAEAPDVA